MVKSFAEKLVVPFEEGAWPSIECPVCGNGHLALQPPADPRKKVEWQPNAATREWNDWGDPTDIRGTFGASLRCSNITDCGDTVHVSGDVAVDYASGYIGADEPFETVLTVRWFHPSLRIVDVPEGTPESVSAELVNVGALVWSNPDAALWSLRKAVELVMDHQGVRKEDNGYNLTLSKRLKEFKTAHPDMDEVVELLDSTRWAGNDGTHGTGHSGKDVLYVVKFVELALESLYSESDRDASLAHARKINTNRGYVPPA